MSFLAFQKKIVGKARKKFKKIRKVTKTNKKKICVPVKFQMRIQMKW